MWTLGSAARTIAELAAAWRAARPFPHLVFDDVWPADQLADLLELLEEEPVEPLRSDLFDFEATAPEPTTSALRAVRDDFARVFAPLLSEVTGKQVTSVDLRAYAYRIGHYLLPHTDDQLGQDRVLAYAYYLPSPTPPRGGELELFACRRERGELCQTTPALRIAPRPNRLVVFDVSALSLHQVTEVEDGLRLSLAGWLQR